MDTSVISQFDRLLGDPRRLAIVEALREGPRPISELATLVGAKPATVRTDLNRLRAAGVLVEAPAAPSGRVRPSKRYQLREPLMTGDPEVRLFVGGLVSLLHSACGETAPAT